MRRFVGVVLLCAAMCCLYTGCDEDGSRTMTPHHPLAVIAGQGLGDGSEPVGTFPLAIMWVDGNVATDLFSVYLKAGDSGYEKMNSDLVRRGPVFGIPNAPDGLGFLDVTFDHTSTSQHSYYIVATNSRGTESPASEEIVVVPADMDMGAQVGGLEPAESDSVEANPTFSWDAVSGASSYLFVLEEVTEYGNVLLWIHKTNGTSVNLGAEGGLTYVGGSLSSLSADTGYDWSVYAINSNNCSIAASYAEFSTDE
jgi:hypothetical protein